MVDLLWWSEESFWVRKSIPFGGMNLAPREIAILVASALLGLLLTSPLSILVPRLALMDRAVVMAPFLLVGFIVASKRVKTLPLELQLFYRFVLQKVPKVHVGKGQEVLKEPEPLPAAGQEDAGHMRKKGEEDPVVATPVSMIKRNMQLLETKLKRSGDGVR